MNQDQSDLEIPVSKANDPLDYELAELLGESTADFLVLCFDGVQFESFGTPYDSPKERGRYKRLVAALNDRSEASMWPELYQRWKVAICLQFGLELSTTADSYRPVASFLISRVCASYSKHLYAAIGLFKTLGDKISAWSIHSVGQNAVVRITSAEGRVFTETGPDLALVIVLAVKRVLLDRQHWR